ncbi:unnamed protein product [Ilex paraguariensis]|uniref:C2 domain-containing protein n=1 Tax=Ilex paraguariensis TaxID=185542 RepID=A0ABC8SRL3_9AQUA
MECRTLEINNISAKDLKNVNLITKMDVYAVVSITGGDKKIRQKTKTAVDRNGNTNPTWNIAIKFTVPESTLRQNILSLEFKIRCEAMLGDKDVGEVHVPLKELLDSARDGKQQFVSYQVRKPSGKPKGELNFSYKFGEKAAGPALPVAHKADEPVTAYPAPPVVGPSSGYGPPPPPSYAAGAGYPPPEGHAYPPNPYPPPRGYYPPPPPPQVAGYGGYPPPVYGGYPPQPPPPGYGYPPPQVGYSGYPPVQQPPKKNKFGLGLGAGLLGGALGGMLIGDMVSDAAYDGGYDGGFDGGFGDGGF